MLLAAAQGWPSLVGYGEGGRYRTFYRLCL